MGLVELLEQIRSNCVDQLLAVIQEKGAEPEVRVFPEQAWRAEDGKLVIDGVLELPVRTDLAVLEGDVLEMVNVPSESMVTFDAVEFDWGSSLHVEMGPFFWQSFSITMPTDEAYNWAPLQDWFWKWFHEDEDHQGADSLLGAVHFLSDPAQQDDVTEFSIDLGSAPIAAFEELLDALSIAGVSLCAIGEVAGAKAE